MAGEGPQETGHRRGYDRVSLKAGEEPRLGRAKQGEKAPTGVAARPGERKRREIQSKHVTKYTVLGSGDVIVENQVRIGKKDLSELLRFGMRLRMPVAFERVEWYGRGPQENYWDRAASVFVGLYRSTAREQFFPYVSPQENGYKTDARWLALRDEQERGLAFCGLDLISFSALRYTIEDMTQKSRGTMHPVDLVERDFVEVNVDYKQTGRHPSICNGTGDIADWSECPGHDRRALRAQTKSPHC